MRAAARLQPSILETTPPNPSDPTTRRLRDAAKRFRVLKEVWLDDFGIDLTSLSSWEEFTDWRQLRHVLVHRLGNWQPGLDPQPRLEIRIRNLGEEPALFRGLVPLTSNDLANSIASAIRFVLEADAR